jgi:hypothetical protein
VKGIELCEKFYYEYGEPMLRERFSQIFDLLAIGIVGSGSECFGYDDEISRDHDFEPGFCIFLPSESVIDSKTEFALERAYAKLPREYMGVERSMLAPVGGRRHGVIRMSEFLLERTGREDGELSIDDWFALPEQALAELTNGKIFSDPSGMMSDIRKRLEYLPETVRRKKLAGELLASRRESFVCINDPSVFTLRLYFLLAVHKRWVGDIYRFKADLFRFRFVSYNYVGMLRFYGIIIRFQLINVNVAICKFLFSEHFRHPGARRSHAYKQCKRDRTN